MPYSAVTQPLPELRIQPGTFSSRLAVHSTCVSPNLTRQEPSACLETLRSKEMARISSNWRLDGRIRGSFCREFGLVRGLVAACARRERKGKRPAARHVVFAARGHLYHSSRRCFAHNDQADRRSSTLQSLDLRSRDIFRRIVDSYLRDGEPVGSRSLSRMLPSSLSPATVRNVMSDLEHLGLIYAPHISAGRLPTQKGLRFFVDAFMELGDLSDEERRVIEAQVKASGSGATLEHMLTEASQMLSGMSRGAGLVLTAKNEVPLKHIEFIQLEPTKALAVLVSQNGDVENRVVDLPAGVTAVAAARGVELPQRPYPRPHAGRGARRDRAAEGRDQDGARHAVAGSGRTGPGGLGRAPKAACRRG